MQRYGVSALDYLGGRVNRHWLVESNRQRLVLRWYPDDSFDDIPYEIEVMRRLKELGWPVPVAVDEPLHDGGQTWCLLT